MSKPRSPPRRRVDGVLLLDKPQGISSNGALQVVRRLYNAAKAGHTGTLDPMATGLLPLCLGEATKFAGELLDADKAYCATLKFGVTTDTADAEGRVLEMRPVAVTEKQLLGAMTAFLGEIHQVPPMFSALKRDGKPLYEYARAGIELERAARRVTIHGLELRSFTGDEAVIHVDCSKGTYVRTLAADIGQVLGCGAHLSALRRTRIGALDLAGAMTLPDLEAMTSAERDACLLPADALLSRLPQVRLSQQETEMILHGQRIAWSGMAGARFRLYAVDGRFIGLGEVDGDACLQPHRLVATAD